MTFLSQGFGYSFHAWWMSCLRWYPEAPRSQIDFMAPTFFTVVQAAARPGYEVELGRKASPLSPGFLATFLATKCCERWFARYLAFWA